MNKIVISLLFGVSVLFSLEFHTYEDALKLQSENGKLIMIDVVRTDCHYCEDMDKNVFQNEEMADWLGSRFIAARINLDVDVLPLGIEVNFTPSFFFVNSKKEIIKKIPGSWGIEDFKDLTKNINKD